MMGDYLPKPGTKAFQFLRIHIKMSKNTVEMQVAYGLHSGWYLVFCDVTAAVSAGTIWKPSSGTILPMYGIFLWNDSHMDFFNLIPF